MNQACENGDERSAGMGRAFEAQAGHITPSHEQFLRHWLQLTALEEAAVVPRRSEIWNLPGQQDITSVL